MRFWQHPAVKIVAGVAVFVLLVMGFMWQRCGLRGCPDVEQLRGYMPDQASVILDHEGQEVSKLYLTQRVVVGVDSLPEHVPNAFIAMEDKRFYKHGGVDWRRVFGAAYRNIKELGIEEGSSTITMQLARNAFPEDLPANQKTIWRKMAEARVAKKIENTFSKEEILELYLNQIYFGNGAYGIQAAAQEYFGKPAMKLTLSEAATLAALPRAPSRLNPRRNRELALKGRAIVLDRMLEQQLIDPEQAKQARNAKLRLRRGQMKSYERAAYFVEAVRNILEEQLGNAIYSEGYTIHTTLDLKTQLALEEEIRRQLSAVESGAYGRYRHTTYAYAKQDTARDDAEGTPYLQAAGVFMDPRTGDVRALVGGRDFDDSQYNRATMSSRQVGSAFKPFVYAAAVAAGFPPSHRLMDRPLRLVLDRRNTWEPKNYDGRFAGTVTMRQALMQSRNVPTVRLAMEVGLDRVVNMAQQIGLEGRIPNVPSVVLGSAETTPLKLTSAFATFATLGNRPQAKLITRVEDRNGRIVWGQETQSTHALDAPVAFIVTNMLKDVVDRGTATAVRGVGFTGVAAGKTGTTNDAADVWFVGYTPRIVGTIWIGFDKRKTVLRGATGGELAAPIWGRVMARAGERTGDWMMPAGVEMLQVDEYGNVLGSNCAPTGVTRPEYFLSGSAPVASCYTDPYVYNDSMYGDSLGYPVDTLSTDSWLARMRARLFGTRVDTTTVPPVAEVTADTVVRDTGPPLLGRIIRRDSIPQRAPIRVNIDSLRRAPVTRDTTRKPPPDTTKPKPPPDTTKPKPPPDTTTGN